MGSSNMLGSWVDDKKAPPSPTAGMQRVHTPRTNVNTSAVGDISPMPALSATPTHKQSPKPADRNVNTKTQNTNTSASNTTHAPNASVASSPSRHVVTTATTMTEAEKEEYRR